MKKQKENSHEGITWSEMGKQNVQAEKVYWLTLAGFQCVFAFFSCVCFDSFVRVTVTMPTRLRMVHS